MSFFNYNNHQLTYKDNKFNLNEIYQILDYELLDENEYVDKEELLTLLNEEYDEDKNFINFLNNDFIEPMIDIFTFMNKNKLVLSDNELFNELWFYLYNKKDVLITPNILKFMYNMDNKNVAGNSGHDIRYKKKHFLEFLKENKIDFEKIDFKDKRVNDYNYILEDIKNSDSRTIHSKKYIILTIKNFKKVSMIKSDLVREYYLNLEDIFYLYSDYVKEYNLKLNEIKYKQELKKIEEIKNKELEEKNIELEKSKKKNLRINKFLNNVTIKSTKLEWIYIASTDLYQLENIYKIGSTERLHKRIQNYQTGRIEEFYYVKIFKCYKSKDLDNHIKHLLKDFLYQKQKELYYGIHITDLIEIITFLVENYDESVEYLYNFIKEKLENSISKEPLIMKPLNIKSITYEIDNETETINIENENKKLIQATLFNFFETLENNSHIKKNDLINKLNLNINNNDVWKEFKNLFKWINSKNPIEYNNKKIFINYK